MSFNSLTCLFLGSGFFYFLCFFMLSNLLRASCLGFFPLPFSSKFQFPHACFVLPLLLLLSTPLLSSLLLYTTINVPHRMLATHAVVLATLALYKTRSSVKSEEVLRHMSSGVWCLNKGKHDVVGHIVQRVMCRMEANNAVGAEGHCAHRATEFVGGANAAGECAIIFPVAKVNRIFEELDSDAMSEIGISKEAPDIDIVAGLVLVARFAPAVCREVPVVLANKRPFSRREDDARDEIRAHCNECGGHLEHRMQ